MRLRVVVLVLSVGAALGSALVVVSALRSAEPSASVAVADAPVPTLGVALQRVEEHALDPASALPVKSARRVPAAPPRPEPAAQPVTHADLSERIAGLLDDPELPEEGRLAVAVVDESGRALFAHDADRPLIPASTQKLVTAAAALELLGDDHRFRTEVRATVGPDAHGVVDGDLVLVGGGDPALATARFGSRVLPERPRTPLEALVDGAWAAGIRHVRGDIIGDGSWLPHEPEPHGWPERYLQSGIAFRSSGLTVDGGRRLYTSRGQLLSEPAADPAHHSAAVLKWHLEERGIRVDGRGLPGPAEAPHHIAAVDSPPLPELLRYTVQRSDNHLADGVFRALGRVDGDGSWTSGEQAARAALERYDLDWDGVVLADGSGLSREDRLTARLLVSLDVAMFTSAGERWQELMAVSGRNGTLRRRLVGTVADGRVFGKTGSLRDVRSLSGAVVGPAARRYHFAVIGNGLTPAEDAAVRRLQDELLLILTGDLYGCISWPVEIEDEEAGEDAEETFELRCAA